MSRYTPPNRRSPLTFDRALAATFVNSPEGFVEMLADCDCEPWFELQGAGTSLPVLAAQHDSQCARIRRLKSERGGENR